METSLAVAVVLAFLVGFLRFVPRGADLVRLRSFNRQALVLLAAICVVAIGLLCWRATSVETATATSVLFASIFVPFYILCAGALRSRSLDPRRDGGRFTL
jgi:hypothetical protein